MISFLAAITLEVQATAHTDFRSPFARKVVTDLCFFCFYSESANYYADFHSSCATSDVGGTVGEVHSRLVSRIKTN